jgi:hypothetical protein
MSRYFFHVMDGHAIVDTVGTEFATLDEARSAGVVTAGQMLAELGSSFWSGKTWTMSVADETGVVIFTLRFAAEL